MAPTWKSKDGTPHLSRHSKSPEVEVRISSRRHLVCWTTLADFAQQQKRAQCQETKHRCIIEWMNEEPLPLFMLGEPCSHLGPTKTAMSLLAMLSLSLYTVMGPRCHFEHWVPRCQIIMCSSDFRECLFPKCRLSVFSPTLLTHLTL